MTATAAQLSALLKGAGELVVLAELGFGYQAPNGAFLSIPTANVNSPLSLPDAANFILPGDVEVQADFFATTYGTAGQRQSIVIKGDSTINQRSIQLDVQCSTPGFGTLRWITSADGTTVPVQAIATADIPLGRNVIKTTHKMNNGAGGNDVKFLTTPDGGVTWQQLGTTVTTAGVTSIWHSTSVLELGAAASRGNPTKGPLYFYSASVFDGIGGTLKASPDFSQAVAGGTTIPDRVGGTWTVGAECVLLESDRQARGLVYFADRSYTTAPNDAPANTIYRACIDSSPDFERAIDLRSLGGRGTTSLTQLVLGNADGALDYLLDLVVDGYEIAFYMGDRSWPRADFVKAFVASVVLVSAPNENQINITLRDKNALLDAAIAGDAISSGPSTGKSKPVILGSVANLDLVPYLIDTTGPTYALNNRPLNTYNAADPLSPLETAPVAAVRDSGVALEKTTSLGIPTANAATDTITWPAAHGLAVDDVFYMATNVFPGMVPYRQYWVLASGLTSTDWKFSATRGGSPVDITGTVLTPVNGSTGLNPRRYYVDAAAATLKLSGTPSGRVTADVIGSTLSTNVGGPSFYGAFMPIPYYGFRYVLDTFTKLTAADRDDATFDALQNSIVLNSPWGVAVLARTNVMDVLDGIALLTNAWYGWNAQGKLTVGKLALQSLDSAQPIDSISAADIEGEPACENLQLQFGKVIANGGPNAAVQTDGIASSVSPFNRGKWGQPYQLQTKTTDTDLGASRYSTSWWLYHKTAADAAPVNFPLNVVFDGSGNPVVADVQNLCDERTALFRPWTRVFRCRVGIDKYALNPGDCVAVTYPRYGLSAGKNFRVVSVRTRVTDRAVDLVLVRQSIPDYLSASHV